MFQEFIWACVNLNQAAPNQSRLGAPSQQELGQGFHRGDGDAEESSDLIGYKPKRLPDLGKARWPFVIGYSSVSFPQILEHWPGLAFSVLTGATRALEPPHLTGSLLNYCSSPDLVIVLYQNRPRRVARAQGRQPDSLAIDLFYAMIYQMIESF